MSLGEYFQLGPGAQGAVDVAVSGKVIGLVESVGSDVKTSKLLDTQKETNIAYNLQVYLGSAARSTVQIYNPNETVAPVSVVLSFGQDGHYLYPLSRIAPGEFVSVDPSELQEAGTPDALGSTIPPDAGTGQLSVYLDSENEDKELIVMGVLEDAVQGKTVCFQGCFFCPAITLFIEIEPDSSSGAVGGSDSFKVWATSENLTKKDVTFGDLSDPELSAWTIVESVSNLSVISAGFGQVAYVGPGSATFTVSHNRCADWVLFPSEVDSKLQCSCTFRSPVFDTASAWAMQASITGPSSINVGEPLVALQTQVAPSGGEKKNWEVISGDASCVELTTDGEIRALAAGTVSVQFRYQIDDHFVDSDPFQVTLENARQLVRLLWFADANTALLAGGERSSEEVAQIKDRVKMNLEFLFGGSDIEFFQDAFPAGENGTTLRIFAEGGNGGAALFDLVNRNRIDSFPKIYIGSDGEDSIDVANTEVDPVPGGNNERQDGDRVADAISRLAAHEVAHSLGLTARNSEISSDDLAIKLSVNSLNLGGDSGRHSGTSDWDELMNAVSPTNLVEGWDIGEFGFRVVERTYLSRILP